MKTLKTLTREVFQLSRYAKNKLPREVSRAWLWSAQNAFLVGSNPATGEKWPDRHGFIRDSRGQHFGNVEPYLNYQKLHRTGRLLRGLKVRRMPLAKGGTTIELYNRVPYASTHQEGGMSNSKVITFPETPPKTSVKLGGDVVPRPFMTPSPKVLQLANKLLRAKIRSFGW